MRKLRISPPVGDVDILYSTSSESSRVKYVLRGSEFHHLAQVLRVKPGISVELRLPDTHKSVDTCVSDVKSDCLVLEAKAPSKSYSIIIPKITLCVGFIKPAKADLLVELAASAGAEDIIFFPANRSQFNLLEIGAKRLERWEKIAAESGKQSGFINDAKVHWASSLSSLLSNINEFSPPDSIKLILDIPTFHDRNDDDTPNMFHWLKNRESFVLEQTLKPAEVMLIIGPEGGLAKDEVYLARQNGFQAVSLGPKVLRTEHAAMASTLLLIAALSSGY